MGWNHSDNESECGVWGSKQKRGGWGTNADKCWHTSSGARTGGFTGFNCPSESSRRHDKMSVVLEDMETLRNRLERTEVNVDDLFAKYDGVWVLEEQKEEEERKCREQRAARCKQWLKNLGLAVFAGVFIAVYWFDNFSDMLK